MARASQQRDTRGRAPASGAGDAAAATPVWVFDIERERMQWANDPALRLWAADSLEELLARDFSTDMSPDTRARLHGYLDLLRQGRCLAETWTLYPQGRPRTVFCRCRPAALDDGRTGMRVEVVGEVECLDPHALRSLEAMRHAPTLLTLHDQEGNVLLRNPAALQRLGAEGRLGDHWVDGSLRERLLADLRRDGLAEAEAPVRTRMGERWHRVEAASARDPVTGEAVIVTTEHDVTDSQLLTESLATANQLLTTLLHSIPVAVLVEDEHRRIRQANRAFCDLFSLPAGPEALVGADCEALLQQARHAFRDPEAFVRRVHEIVAVREPVEAEEWALADGRVLERSYRPVFVDERHRGHLWQYTDVTDRRRTESALREEAERDWLTGVTNQRGMREYLAQLHADVVRSKRTAALLMIDLDHFKLINDTFGHAAGDDVLIAVVQAVGTALRRSDRLGRIGGEEFLAILPDTDLAGARETAARVQRAPRERGCARPDGAGVTVSVGLALMAPGDPSPLAASNRADTALYAAKRGGRDRVAEQLS